MAKDIWVVLVTDGDADYSTAYHLENVETSEQAAAFDRTLPADNGDYFYRVHKLGTTADLEAQLASLEE